MENEKQIGLCLSGGGYRAAAFHLGALRKLHELGVLEDVKVISTISGGSIAGAYYLLHKDNFSDFETGFKNGLRTSIIKKILLSTHMIALYVLVLSIPSMVFYLTKHHHPYAWTVTTILVMGIAFLCFQFWLLPFTKLKQKGLEDVFFGKKTMGTLSKKPKLAINATNLETGTLWIFSQERAGDSSYDYPKNKAKPIKFKPMDFRISLAVNSSTNVPIAFGPVRIPITHFIDKADYNRVQPKLMDGGLYDNQGIHKLTQKQSEYYCDVVICCDGSEPFNYTFNGNNSFMVLNRAIDVMMRRIKNMQFVRNVYESPSNVAYYSLDWEYEHCVESFVKHFCNGYLKARIIDFFKFPIEIVNEQDRLIEFVKNKINFKQIIENGLSTQDVKIISKIKTGLSAFTDAQIEQLAKHGSVLTELQINLYYPHLKK